MTTLDSCSFDTLFPQWRTHLMLTGVLSLAAVDFVRPDGMILLYFGLIYVLRELPYIVLNVPVDHPVRSYLARAGFFAALPPDIVVEPVLNREETRKSTRFNGNCASLLELTLAQSATELQSLLDRIVNAAEQLLHYSNRKACDIGILVSEIWQNANQHAGGNPSAGIMQVYGNGSNRRLVLAIGDDGMGIARSLTQNEQYKDIANDCDAIQTAVLPNVSRLTDATRGNGLHRVIQRATRDDGIVSIRSGSARSRYQGERNVYWNQNVPHLPGTQVVISLAAA